METIANLNKLTLEKANKIREDIGVSQKFICICLGLSGGAWSNWHQAGKIPKKYHGKMLETFIALKQLKSGRRMFPVKNSGAFDTGLKETVKNINEVLEILRSNATDGMDNRILRKSTFTLLNEIEVEIKELANGQLIKQ